MNLPPISKFIVHGESNVPLRWEKWLNRFDNFMIAADITDYGRMKALLIHYAGEEVYDIYSTFSTKQIGGNDDAGYKTLCKSLTAHFEPKRN